MKDSPDRLYAELMYEIIGGLYTVHSELGAGFVHRIYTNACYHELSLRGLAMTAHKRMSVAYKGKVIGDVAFGHLIIDGKVMVFPAAIRHLDDLPLEISKPGCN